MVLTIKGVVYSADEDAAVARGVPLAATQARIVTAEIPATARGRVNRAMCMVVTFLLLLIACRGLLVSCWRRNAGRCDDPRDVCAARGLVGRGRVSTGTGT